MPMSDYLAQIRALVGHRMLCLPSVSGIIRNADGDVLLVRNTGADEWTTPGGMIEPLERPAEAIVRELREELGIVVKPIALLGVFSGPEYHVRYPNGDEIVFVSSTFACELIAGAPQPDLDEIVECRFVSAAQLEQLQTPLWLDDMFSQIAQRKQYS